MVKLGSLVSGVDRVTTLGVVVYVNAKRLLGGYNFD
jgi:hypothetical protein